MDATSHPTSSNSYDSPKNYCQTHEHGEKELSLRIDKLALVLDIPPQLAEGMFEYLYGCVKEDVLPEYSLSRAFGSGHRRYKLSLKGRVPCKDDADNFTGSGGFLIQVGPKNPDDAPVRLDINPECLNLHGFTHLRKTITGIIGVDWPWVQLARVTRVDAALDVNGCSPNDWAWDMPKRRLRHFYFYNGEARTVYLGEKHGDWLAIYDKARQLKLPADILRTRIEFRKKRLPGSVQDLRDLMNPFKDLLVVDPTALKGLPDPLRAAMMTVGQIKGIKGILALFPSAVQPKRLEQLKASIPAWWTPDEIWKAWPSMLDASLPGLFGLTPKSIGLVQSYKKLSVPSSGSAPASSYPVA